MGSEFRVRRVQYLDRVAGVLVMETQTSSDFFSLQKSVVASNRVFETVGVR